MQLACRPRGQSAQGPGLLVVLQEAATVHHVSGPIGGKKAVADAMHDIPPKLRVWPDADMRLTHTVDVMSLLEMLPARGNRCTTPSVVPRVGLPALRAARARTMSARLCTCTTPFWTPPPRPLRAHCASAFV